MKSIKPNKPKAMIVFYKILFPVREKRSAAVSLFPFRQISQSVYDAINQLRRRPDINMPEVPKGLTKDQMREVIRRERRIELTFEGLYYSDILRWKTAEKENNGMMHNYEGIEVVKRSFNPKRDYLWPIPYNQTVLNPNLEQNPNWD